MCLTLVCLPLLGAVFSGFGGFCFGNKGSSILSTVCVFFSFFFSVLCFFKLGVDGQTVTFTLFPWIHSGLFYMNWGFLFDSLTAVILVVVTGISAMVHLYSISYIEGDPHRSRFISYLSFFTFFILILVTADNFMQMFVGWEGVGLCSYLLINFWFTRIQANKAAIKAMIINRIGDFGLALGIFFIFYQFGSVDYATVFCMAPIGSEISISFYFFEYSFNVVTIICLLLFVGSVGKSAQLGLHTWLPDAIEGPTPVSALIHAATMVTAGVFLLVRCSSLFEYSSFALIVVTVFGAITAFFAATTGIVQNDLKKVIAYSTCSQLGYIIFACGLSSYSVGMFHLANHAVFKALLFLTAGSVIHAISDEQDIRKMGGLLGLLPFSYASMFVGSLALTGFPFLTGYYSKDLILEVAYGSYTFNGHFAHFFGSLAAFFTAFYSIRLIYLTFISEPRGFKKVYENVHEGSLYISFPLFILSFGSIFVGYLFKDIIVGVGSDFFKHAVFTHPQNLYLIEAEFIPHSVKLIPILFSFIGFISSFFVLFL